MEAVRFYNDDGIAMVVCTAKDFDELLDDRDKLYYLEAGGVDNWEWYGEAMTPYWKQKDEEEENEE